MTEPSYDPRPELHEECVNDDRRGACPTYPVTCRDQQELWDSGYAAAVKRAEAAESKLAELVREVRGVLAGMGYTAPIHAILAKYDPKPEGGS
jgi:hypothetical protein